MNICDLCANQFCIGKTCPNCKAYSDSILGCLCKAYKGSAVTACPYFTEKGVKNDNPRNKSVSRTACGNQPQD